MMSCLPARERSMGDDGGNLGVEVTAADSACQQRHSVIQGLVEEAERTRDRALKAERNAKLGP